MAAHEPFDAVGHDPVAFAERAANQDAFAVGVEDLDRAQFDAVVDDRVARPQTAYALAQRGRRQPEPARGNAARPVEACHRTGGRDWARVLAEAQHDHARASARIHVGQHGAHRSRQRGVVGANGGGGAGRQRARELGRQTDARFGGGILDELEDDRARRDDRTVVDVTLRDARGVRRFDLALLDVELDRFDLRLQSGDECGLRVDGFLTRALLEFGESLAGAFDVRLQPCTPKSASS